MNPRTSRRVWTKRIVVVGLVVWFCAVGLLAWLAPVELGSVLVLLVLGPVIAGLFQVHRQHRALLRKLDDRSARLDRLATSTSTTTGELAAVMDRLDSLAERSVSVPHLTKALSATAADVITRTRKGVAVDLLLTYRQIEALQNLYAVAGVDRPMPQTRGWASSPDLLLLLANLVEREQPSLIVECGSGTSTLWLAMVLRRFEIKGRVVALEHQESYVETVRGLVDRHGLADVVDVRHAPLEHVEVNGEAFQWYARESWTDLEGIDLLFVDGPPGDLGAHARLPALPLLVAQLHPDAVVVLDDMIRTDEQEVLAEWLRDYPDYAAERVRLEKNAALLRRQSAYDSADRSTTAAEPSSTADAGTGADAASTLDRPSDHEPADEPGRGDVPEGHAVQEPAVANGATAPPR